MKVLSLKNVRLIITSFAIVIRSCHAYNLTIDIDYIPDCSMQIHKLENVFFSFRYSNSYKYFI